MDRFCKSVLIDMTPDRHENRRISSKAAGLAPASFFSGERA